MVYDDKKKYEDTDNQDSAGQGSVGEKGGEATQDIQDTSEVEFETDTNMQDEDLEEAEE